MSTDSETKVLPARPVSAVVTTLLAIAREVADLVLHQSVCSGRTHSLEIKLANDFLIGKMHVPFCYASLERGARFEIKQIDREMPAARCQSLGQRGAKRVGSLVWQSRNQIETETDSAVACKSQCVQRPASSMNPSEWQKFRVMKRLHPYAQSIHTQVAPRPDRQLRDVFRVCLERDLAVSGNPVVGSNHRKDRLEPFNGDTRRRSATEVQRVDLARVTSATSYFGDESRHVSFLQRSVSRDCEGAIRAANAAERKVDVDSEGHACVRRTGTTRLGGSPPTRERQLDDRITRWQRSQVFKSSGVISADSSHISGSTASRFSPSKNG